MISKLTCLATLQEVVWVEPSNWEELNVGQMSLSVFCFFRFLCKEINQQLQSTSTLSYLHDVSLGQKCTKYSQDPKDSTN